MSSNLLAFFIYFFFATGQTNWLKTKDPWGSAKTLALNYYWKTHQYPWPVAGWFLSTRILGWKFCHAQLVRNNKANSGESCANKLILLSLPRLHRLFIHYPGEGEKKIWETEAVAAQRVKLFGQLGAHKRSWTEWSGWSGGKVQHGKCRNSALVRCLSHCHFPRFYRRFSAPVLPSKYDPCCACYI